jgi:hypothetical protein
MRAVLQFLALMALGLAAAVVIALVFSGANDPRGASVMTGLPSSRAGGVDYGSFLMGLATGIALTGLARIGWTDLPRRAIHWMISNHKTMRRAVWSVACLAVIVFL